MKMLIVVASTTGRTRLMADAVAEGARDAGAQVLLRNADEAQEADLVEADAIVLGSGVHMGGVQSSMSAFFERMAPLWLQGKLVGKLGAAFASAGEGERGGAELTLLALLANLAEHGLLLVPMHNRLQDFRAGGSHWGPMARTNPRRAEVEEEPGPTEPQLRAARSHGGWVAECTARWLAGSAP